MITITNNKKLSLLNHFKKIKYSELRIVELKNLIKENKLKNFELKSIQLKAILFLFPKLDRFNAFKLLLKRFDIKLSALSELEIKVLSACLSQDPAFNDLLPFDKKNFGGIFPAKQNVKRMTPYSIPKRTEDKIYNRCQSNTNSRESNNESQAKVTKRSQLSLAQFRLSIIKECSESRLNFFKRNVQEYGHQAIIASMKIENLKNFIKLFPPNDAIKFLNSPLMRDQIEGFQRQNGQLSKEFYIDLLNYFKPYQRDAVKKLLRPISPVISTKLLKLGAFKENKAKFAYTLLPDIVPSDNMLRTR